MDKKWGLLLLLAGGAFVLAKIANDRRLNPNLRQMARYAEGDAVQGLETGLFRLIAAGLF